MKRAAGTPGILTLLSILAIAGTPGVARGGVNTWTTHGPQGAAVTAIAIGPATHSTLYAAAVGGLYKSVDGGLHWNSIDVGLGITVRSLAVDPANPTTVYAATLSDGVYKSLDGGDSWSPANGGMTSWDVEALVIDPQSPGTIYAGTFEYGCEGFCLFKSTNGGRSWTPTGRTPDVLSLAVDPRTPSTLYAGTYGSGIFKSEDGGDSWRAINVGLTGNFVPSMVIDPLTPTTIYAAPVGYPSGPYPVGGVFKSTDGGETWNAANRGLTADSVRELAINPRNPSTLYAGTPVGIFKSSNGGDSWTAMNDGLSNTDVLSLAIDPADPDRLYAGTAGGGIFEWETPGPCPAGSNTLCLNGGRFAVTTAWATRDGHTGAGQAVALTGDTGYFTFFDPANIELMVKVLNGCGVNSRYWTFAAGLTDVHVVLTVTDNLTRAVRTYTNEQGVPFQPIQDTSAFTTCP